MLTPEQIQAATPKLRLIQIISLAILIGAVIFAAMVGLTVDWNTVPGQGSLMTLMGTLTGMSMYFLSLIIPSLFATTTIEGSLQNRGQKSADQSALIRSALKMLTNNRIIFCSIVVGAIFLNLITFMLERSYLSLGIIVIGFIMLVITFPFKPRLLDNLSDQVQQIRDEMKLM